LLEFLEKKDDFAKYVKKLTATDLYKNRKVLL